MLTTIEDLILHIYDPMNGFDRKALPARDRSILFSMASQLKKPLAFTEKQARLALKIINENKHLYERIDELNSLLANPLYKYTFRSIDSSCRIFRISIDKEYIAIKFPFDNKLNKLLDKIPGRKVYNIEQRSHMYHLTESNIKNIMSLFKDLNFEIDPQILEWYNEIESITQSPTSFVPSINVKNEIELLNCNSYIQDYFNKNKKDNLVSNLFLAKSMDLFFNQHVHDTIQSLDISEITKKYLTNDNHAITVAKYFKNDIAMLVEEIDAYPVLMLVDDNEVDFTAWVTSFIQYGVKQSEMSVLFRSDKNTAFNEYVKNQQLNNLVDDNTKVVFIKNKMPKILYKLNFTPKIVVSTSTFFVHYTTQKLVDSHPAVMYYTEKQNIGKKIAQL